MQAGWINVRVAGYSLQPGHSTCFGHYYAHHQELASIMLIITLVVSFCKDGGVSVRVKLLFLVVYVQFQIHNTN